MTHLSLHDHDGSSGASDQDTLPPLPHPGAAPWPMPLPYQFPIPHPYDLPQPFPGGPCAGSAGSQHSGEYSLDVYIFGLYILKQQKLFSISAVVCMVQNIIQVVVKIFLLVFLSITTHFRQIH